jgi:nucleobase:cation symporter-1, NCS1 family
MLLLDFLQTRDYSSTTRAGTFFAGLGLFMSQITINLIQNSVSCGMDLASMAPRYIDVTRGALIMCLVGYLTQPWRFVNQAGVFIAVLNSFGTFVAPLASINCVDFWIVRKMNWKVPDLYKGSEDNIYWFTAGLNWRAFLAWTLVTWPSLPGFVSAVTKVDYGLGWTRVFQVTWIVGFCGGGIVYYIICFFFPPPGGPNYVKEELNTVHNPEPPVVDADASSLDEEKKRAQAQADVADVEKNER